jgi:two-component system nitrogen regulation response regulator GlnG
MLAQNSDTVLEEPGSLPDCAKKSAARVLVVDDERLVRWSVTEALRARGLEVFEACDAASAIRTFDRRCDLILLDLHLLDANDLRVLSFIRAQAPSLPVIVMTAFATREIVEGAAALGALVINKPFDLDDLTRTVERTLDGRLY